MLSSYIKKLKKKNIPASYYILILVSVFAIVAVIFIAGYVNNTPITAEEKAEEAKQVSDKSQRIIRDMHLGMPKDEVIRRMGLPDFAVAAGQSGSGKLGQSDIALELRWKNPACREVAVMFSPEPHEVIGWDDGTEFCKSAKPTDEALSCSREENAQYCR
jgi:hypothetical protein